MWSVCFSAVWLSLITGAAASALLPNSNAIKFGPGPTSSAAPDALLLEGGEQNLAIDTVQPLLCLADSECGQDEFCFESRGLCLQCKKRRKRCTRSAMCCTGNICSNGVCQPSNPDLVLQAEVEDLVSISTVQKNTTVILQSKSLAQDFSQNLKGLEGENCLRSSDCAEGLCCARHFWSKICKPVLKEGQVCTKHKRKGTHALEIFQRCDCGDNMTCRMQRGDHGKASRSLHTCQRH